jgi:predicted transcriptional regulator
MPEYKKQHSEITCDFSTTRLKILRQKRLFTNDKLVNRRYSIYFLSKKLIGICVLAKMEKRFSYEEIGAQ